RDAIVDAVCRARQRGGAPNPRKCFAKRISRPCRRRRAGVHAGRARWKPTQGEKELTDWLGRSLSAVPALRRLAWRVGRCLYSAARGEQNSLEIESDGEAYFQLCALRGVPREPNMRAFDIGANQGDWTRSLLTLIPEERRTRNSICIDLFEPVPSTRQ